MSETKEHYRELCVKEYNRLRKRTIAITEDQKSKLWEAACRTVWERKYKK